MSHHRSLIALASLASVAVVAGCGSGCGAQSTGPTVQPAHIFGLTRFKPGAPVMPGRRTVVSFAIRTPSGKTLTQYKECCDPHAGVDLIVVRSDDSHVQYIDADAEADGRVSVPVIFPTPGRYRIVVDAYPKVTGPSTPFNFQLFKWVTVRGNYHPKPLPPYRSTEVVDGYHFTVQGHPHLKAIQPTLLRRSRHRPGRTQGQLHELARGARARDLLPPGLARLLAHPRLQTGCQSTASRRSATCA